MPEQPSAVDRDLLTLAWLARVLERACTDLTLPQYRLLAFIARGDERASDVAERLALARPTVSATIDTLVERGVLERTAIDTDRRAVRLTITPEGKDLMNATQVAMRARLDDVLSRVEDPALVGTALDELLLALSACAESRREAKAEARRSHASTPTATETAPPSPSP